LANFRHEGRGGRGGWPDFVEIGNLAKNHKAAALVLQEMADLPKLAKSEQAVASHATDFDPPIY
jgi:hypothetical protein